MKIAWLSMTPIDEAMKAAELKGEYNGAGWMTSLIPLISEKSEINLTVICMVWGINEVKVINVGNIEYYLVPLENRRGSICTDITYNRYIKVLDIIKPDVLHIFGTETLFTITMLKAASSKVNVVVQITGLVSVIEKQYLNGVDLKWVKRRSIGDIIRGGGIKKLQEDFKKRGEIEIKALEKAKYIIGKTTWDEIYAKLYNDKCKYYKNNEILRDKFYDSRWDINKIEKYSIFMSQGSYSIKGLHFMIKAMPYILKKYPEAKLYIAGADIIKYNSFMDKIKITSYGKYIKEMIENLSLKNNVIFTGPLNEVQMCDRLSKSNVFISPSTMENESNSLSEAKLMGVPVIASYVGGVVDRIEHGVDGFLYNCNDYNLIAHYVIKVFNESKLAEELSRNSRKNALVINDKTTNYKKLIEIYKEIIQGE